MAFPSFFILTGDAKDQEVRGSPRRVKSHRDHSQRRYEGAERRNREDNGAGNKDSSKDYDVMLSQVK